MEYRKEIDGIRAISVLSVILFHAGFDFVKGGFIGVDIFFVISGFLITSIIANDHDQQRFSLLSFYERRARRILPALYFMLCGASLGFYAIATPSDLMAFSKSLIATILFYSNIYFYANVSYFSQDSAMMPLMHSWSLAVEEQFYIIFPLIMLGVMKLKSVTRIILLFIALLFLIKLSQTIKNDQPAAAFYLAQVRGWEIASGALLALVMREGRVRKWQQAIPLALTNIIAAAALALVVVPMVVVDGSMGWPSKLTLIPVAGTCLLLAFATQSTWAGRWLGIRPLVLIGLCSYSVYLWHYPIFAFARYQAAAPITLSVQMLLIGLTMVIGYFSWRVIEQPFRQRSRFTRQQIFIGSVAGIAAFGLLAGWGIYAKGWPGRWSPESQRLIAVAELPPEKAFLYYGYGKCFMAERQSVATLDKSGCIPASKIGASGAEKRRVIVFGDSHAAHLMPGVRTVFEPRGFAVGQWTGAGCRPFIFTNITARCLQMYQRFMRNIVPQLTANDIVILSSRWHSRFTQLDEAQMASALGETLRELDASAVTNILVGSTPEYYRAPPLVLARRGAKHDQNASMDARDTSKADEIVRSAANRFSTPYFEPRDFLCDHAQPDRCLVMQAGQMLYIDQSHLSPTGSNVVVQEMMRTAELKIQKPAFTW